MSESFTTKTAYVETLGLRLRSNLTRSAARAIARSDAVKALDLTESRTVRLPRTDNEIAKAWLLRAARRMGVCPVADPKWKYEPDPTGPGAWQMATVRCLKPTTDWERELFSRVRLDGMSFNYIDQDNMPSLTAVWGG